MKKVSFFTIALFCLLASCKEKKSPEQQAADNVNKNIKNMVEKIQDNKGEIMEDKAKLEKLPPLTMEELKKIIPESLMGAKRAKYNAVNTMGAGMATGEYEIGEDKKIELSVFDCAGPAGAGIYSMQYLGLMNVEQESDDEYTKTVNYGDGKAYEHCEKSTNDCTLTWFAGGRFLVTLTGDKTGVDALKQAGKELKF